ncbi:unnamed protein product [Pleuronectes platessa]|uniref:Uncharacterized protein n=1 Tax=Pleuronectes platessa TaxID=8262 RepID=A0A9N7VU28_PLEPL|nr:unnamed protein product [Pleuronectes platessa]
MDDPQEKTSYDEEVQVVSKTSPCVFEGSTNLPEGVAAAGLRVLKLSVTMSSGVIGLRRRLMGHLMSERGRACSKGLAHSSAEQESEYESDTAPLGCDYGACFNRTRKK